jgi:tripartite-type tricarboxylate transporter receptor subunit TctC
MFHRVFKLAVGAAILLGSLAAVPAVAQSPDYPTKTTKLISPFSAGGTNDFLSRAVARKLETALGKPVVVENRTGANGMIGADFVAKNPGDPYLLFMGNGATHGSNSTLYPKITYDAVKDFSAVGMVAFVPLVLIVNTALPIKSIPELLAYAKAHPGSMSFGTSGLGSTANFAGEKFKQLTGIDMVHIPYKGDAPAVTDVLGGQLPLAFISITSVISHLNSGRMRILAVANAKRSPSIPDVPTFAEAGVKEMEFATWYAIMAPAGIPKDIVNRLNQEIGTALDSADMKQSFATQGAEPTKFTPDELGAFVKAQIARFARMIKELSIRAE